MPRGRIPQPFRRAATPVSDRSSRFRRTGFEGFRNAWKNPARPTPSTPSLSSLEGKTVRGCQTSRSRARFPIVRREVAKTVRAAACCAGFRGQRRPYQGVVNGSGQPISARHLPRRFGRRRTREGYRQAPRSAFFFAARGKPGAKGRGPRSDRRSGLPLFSSASRLRAVKARESISFRLAHAQRDPAPPIMVGAIVEHVVALAERLQVSRPVVGRIMIQIGRRLDDRGGSDRSGLGREGEAGARGRCAGSGFPPPACTSRPCRRPHLSHRPFLRSNRIKAESCGQSIG